MKINNRKVIQFYIDEVQKLIDTENENLQYFSKVEHDCFKNLENVKNDKFLHKKYTKLQNKIKIIQDNILYLSGRKDAYIECIRLYKI